MKNIFQMAETIEVDIKETDKLNLTADIYEALFDKLKGIWYIGENAKQYNILDCYCSRSGVKKYLPEGIDCKYYGLDPVSHYLGDDNEKCIPEIVSDINQIPVHDNTFDVIFMHGNRFGYGNYHSSLFEIERVIKNDGVLVCSLSKYIYQKGINQLLLVYRNWHYEKVIEIKYTLVDDKNTRPVQTSVFFTIYNYKG